ncbi:MAG: hypothetical protein PHC62_00440 [Candidatus Izemoplasmatales bacterium]|nr:hypothetical protein [Candidatus Izemoplasmatales bacterium]
METYIRINKSNVVEFINTTPFDPREGLGMSREELDQQGKFVSSIPEPNTPLGQRAIPMYNPDTNSVYYKYETVPLKTEKRVELMEKAINAILINQMKGDM